jgi:hypothetical protein
LKDKKLWKELTYLLLVEGELPKAVLAETRMGVCFIHSVADTISAMFFSSETACRPPGELLSATV